MSGLFSLESWSTVWTHRESFLLGLGNTLQTAVCALALAFIIGAALGLMSTSGSKLLRIIARIYVEFVQNTPLLLQLCFLYYALAFAGVSLGVIRTGIIALGVYTGAYMGEVVRAAIESVPKGQFEAAQAQGFNYLQRMGYIILPQSIPVMLPPMVNQVVNLFKNTSCLYIVGGAGSLYVDPTHKVQLLDMPEFPAEFYALAKAQTDELAALRSRTDAKWVFVSPAADFRADGAKTGKYILGGEELTLSGAGESVISYADYALGMVDLIESGAHVGERVSLVADLSKKQV